MEVFRDLYISVELDGMAAIADRIEQSPPDGWARDRAAEERIRAASSVKPRPTFCFTGTERDARPSATLFLTQKDAGTFYVSNVIPVSKRQLAYGEYNAIVEDFYERVIRPYTSTSDVKAHLTESPVELEHWMSPATAEKLRRFSASANRGTGSSHPSDQERWKEFVLAAHRDQSRMDASDLRRWLIEVEDWSPEVADQLALEYEFGRNLLAFADGYRRSA
jgi:hypothetical protein